jgi:regulatory protein SWI6
MVRGIAVMRRRSDSYVNATQILKVAGVDKGRRTKILEKEILPGKHEIVQGGYGKYQGTWSVCVFLLTMCSSVLLYRDG